MPRRKTRVKIGFEHVLARALAVLAERAELARGIAQRHAVLREERARRLHPEAAERRAIASARPAMRSA